MNLCEYLQRVVTVIKKIHFFFFYSLKPFSSLISASSKFGNVNLNLKMEKLESKFWQIT